MLIRKPSDIPSSEITPESVYINRRNFIASVAAGAVAAVVPGEVSARHAGGEAQDKLNSWEDITTYNNF